MRRLVFTCFFFIICCTGAIAQLSTKESVHDTFGVNMHLLHILEQIKTAFASKDTAFLKNIFAGENIKGNKTMKNGKDTQCCMDSCSSVFEYVSLTKEQCISELENIFAKETYLNVDYKDVEIEINKAYPYICGIHCLQQFNFTGNSCLVGKLTMIWNFKNADKPICIMCVWQTIDDPNEFSVYSIRVN